MLAVLIGALPFLLYRLTSQRGQAFCQPSLCRSGALLCRHSGNCSCQPACSMSTRSLRLSRDFPLPRIAAILGTGAISFLIYWFAAVINWMWNLEFRAKRIAKGASIFGAVCVLVLGYGFFLQIHPAASHVLLTGPAFAWGMFWRRLDF